MASPRKISRQPWPSGCAVPYVTTEQTSIFIGIAFIENDGVTLVQLFYTQSTESIPDIADRNSEELYDFEDIYHLTACSGDLQCFQLYRQEWSNSFVAALHNYMISVSENMAWIRWKPTLTTPVFLLEMTDLNT